jgi:hypothetical protein
VIENERLYVILLYDPEDARGLRLSGVSCAAPTSSLLVHEALRYYCMRPSLRLIGVQLLTKSVVNIENKLVTRQARPKHTEAHKTHAYYQVRGAQI